MCWACCSPRTSRLRGCPGRQRAPRASENIRWLPRAARSAASPRVSRKVPGCPVTHCSPACLLAKKCTKWQKLSITPESKGPSGLRNDTTAPGWEVPVTPSGVTVSSISSPVTGQAEVTRAWLSVNTAGQRLSVSATAGSGSPVAAARPAAATGRPAASSRYRAIASRCPAGSSSPNAVASASASSSRVLCCVSIVIPPSGGSGWAGEQGAEVEAAALDGGVLAEDLGVDAAVGGQVGACGLGAGVKDGVRAHRLERAALGAAVCGPARDDDRRGRGPGPGAAAGRYDDGGAVV